jgi:hypothetical protein
MWIAADRGLKKTKTGCNEEPEGTEKEQKRNEKRNEKN